MMEYKRIHHPQGSQDHLGILMHGFGADETDMLSLAEYFSTVGEWICPRAPFGLSQGGFAWFPRIGNVSEDYFHTLINYDPPELPEEVRDLQNLILRESRNRQIILAGFSQGGMVAIELALRIAPHVLMLFSTGLLAQDRWRRSVGVLKQSSVFHSHGNSDSILSFHQAELLSNLLSSHSKDYHSVFFEGDHSLPDSVVQEAADWLSQLLS